MIKFAIRLLTLAMFTTATAAVPMINAAKAAGGEAPSPSTDSTKDKKKKHDKSSSIDDPKFIEGYRSAYGTIYDRHDYTSAIAQLKALGQDYRADVANLIGYSYRKLGDYALSQVWYERALKADPKVLARLRSGTPVAKSTLLKMLRRYAGRHDLGSAVADLVVDTRLP